MGIVLEIIFQLILEFILEIFGELALDGIFHGLSRKEWVRKSFNALLALAMYTGLGIITGFLSLLIFPTALISSSSLHGISLLITPTLAGLTMALVGRLRRREGKVVTQLESFGYGFCFAFGMALIRFLFTR